MIEYKIKNKVNELPLSSVKFEGDIKEQIHAFFRERVTNDFAKSEIYGETEEQFRKRDDDEFKVGTWRGEFWGKWMISAARVARYLDDGELVEFIRQGAYNVIETQDEDGYIGSYKDPENVLPCDPKFGMEVYGTLCDHNWNVWCRKYTIWALIEAHQLTGDKKILDATVKTAYQLMDMLERLGLKIADCGTFNGLPAGSIMKPMLLLYRITEDERFLNFALGIAGEWEREDGKVPNIISNALSMKPIHTWYEHPEKWAKAYEMMSCLDGLVELYRITGTEKYLKVCECMYELLWKHEQNLLFSVGFNDQLAGGSLYANSLTEPCDVIHWIRLCYELYRVTGEEKYMNAIERAVYNPLLAASFKDGTWGARCVRSVGRHMTTGGQTKMKHGHCCVNNMPRGFLNAAECFVMTVDGGIRINLYTDFVAKSDIADVTIGGSYLKDGRVNITLNAKRDFTLSLRIPDWSRETKLDGAVITPKDGYYSFDVKAGEREASLEFDMAVTLRELNEAPTRFPKEDFRVRRYCQDNIVTDDMMTWDKRATLLYGPLLLTRSKLVGNTELEMFESQTVAHRGYSVTVTPIEYDGVRCAFRVKFENGASAVEFNMCDYASGTNIPSFDDMKLFNIFI